MSADNEISVCRLSPDDYRVLDNQSTSDMCYMDRVADWSDLTARLAEVPAMTRGQAYALAWALESRDYYEYGVCEREVTL